jgi:hypothetical protein
MCGENQRVHVDDLGSVMLVAAHLDDPIVDCQWMVVTVKFQPKNRFGIPRFLVL